MIHFIANTFVVALIAGFVLALAHKWGIVEYMQVHGNDFFAKMAHCNFCLSWWIGCAVAFAVWLATGDNSLLYVPVCSTLITRNLV